MLVEITLNHGKLPIVDCFDSKQWQFPMVQPRMLSVILYSRNPSKTNPENPKLLHKGGTCHLTRK